jgi:hypothetical protein
MKLRNNPFYAPLIVGLFMLPFLVWAVGVPGVFLRLGINTDTPDSPLDIEHTSNDGLRVCATGDMERTWRIINGAGITSALTQNCYYSGGWHNDEAGQGACGIQMLDGAITFRTTSSDNTFPTNRGGFLPGGGFVANGTAAFGGSVDVDSNFAFHGVQSHYVGSTLYSQITTYSGDPCLSSYQWNKDWYLRTYSSSGVVSYFKFNRNGDTVLPGDLSVAGDTTMTGLAKGSVVAIPFYYAASSNASGDYAWHNGMQCSSTRGWIPPGNGSIVAWSAVIDGDSSPISGDLEVRKNGSALASLTVSDANGGTDNKVGTSVAKGTCTFVSQDVISFYLGAGGHSGQIIVYATIDSYATTYGNDN